MINMRKKLFICRGKNINKVRRKKSRLLAACLLVAVLAACGKTDASEGSREDSSTSSPAAEVEEEYAAAEAVAAKTAEKQKNTTVDATEQETAEGLFVEPLPEMTEEEVNALQYVEKVALEDYFGDKTEYDVYVPKDAQINEGYVFFMDHGLKFDAMVFNIGSDDLLDEVLDDSVQFDISIWGNEGYDYTEMEFGEIIRCGDDRFRMASAMGEDFNGTPYKVKKIYFMDVIQEGVGVAWNLQVSEFGADDVTNAIIDEISKCYRVNLEEIKVDDAWFAGEATRNEQWQDEYEPSEEETVLEKVDGYQYMGLAAISDPTGKTQCPIMIPMGSQTRVAEDVALAYMHGVDIAAGLVWSNDFDESVKFGIDTTAKTYEKNPDNFANVRTGSPQPISGYGMAKCAVITYEKRNIFTDEFLPKVDVLCYIRVQREYVLRFTITLSYEEYDSSTNTLLKELETAYGIDLSEYYNEED